jgi:hypothetical protein
MDIAPSLFYLCITNNLERRQNAVQHSTCLCFEFLAAYTCTKAYDATCTQRATASISRIRLP